MSVMINKNEKQGWSEKLSENLWLVVLAVLGIFLSCWTVLYIVPIVVGAAFIEELLKLRKHQLITSRAFARKAVTYVVVFFVLPMTVFMAPHFYEKYQQQKQWQSFEEEWRQNNAAVAAQQTEYQHVTMLELAQQDEEIIPSEH